ncbi:receptor expression-enhancing protein 2 isoform X2 [Gallus gallus]|uniref:receptor expression-enhancing protein 2 isoform X2 n=1 Tax=Gallus gallus TaxID=9031 RepID=UPI0003506431|nr:receptor expression-enhancing protein 2 isoform X2 [Gallus gallus]XP_040538499.1 receptor expression-enhancing protein 2 isoform X2 [Gallus gallus]
MVSWIISRLVVLIFGTLYPAYSSYKAVKTKNVKEYVKWMMYWIVFAFFTTAETLTDIVLSWPIVRWSRSDARLCSETFCMMKMSSTTGGGVRQLFIPQYCVSHMAVFKQRPSTMTTEFPFYFELKIAFVIWLLSPYTKGSSVLYRKFVHPTLSNKEKEIDEYITQARDKSYETMMRVGKRGLNLAANAAVTAAAKGQGVLSEKLRSFSMQDLTLIRDEDAVHLQSHESQLRPSGGSLLETIEDSASCYSSGEESSVAQRPNGTPSEIRTDPSDEDAGDKLPKRTQSLKAPKKMTKSELPVKSVKARPKKKAAGSFTSGESS